MRFLALATDYDGTLTADGLVGPGPLKALERLKASGRTAILVTGRELEDLQTVFEHLDLFDAVVAENGAVLHRPSKRTTRVLAAPPQDAFVQALRARGVAPLFVGNVIVATREPHERTVVDVIRDLGLEITVAFNKGAVMALPSGVNKATGLAAALQELGLSAHNVVGIGDAENDHAFLRACECAVAVRNGLPLLRNIADFVTSGDSGDGVVELVDRLLENDLADFEPRLTRHHIVLGTRGGEEVRVPPYGVDLLFSGSPGGGKSTLATGFLENLVEAGYQVCVVDPEGDYETLEGILVPIGSAERAPQMDELMGLLVDPRTSVAVNLMAVDLKDRPAYFLQLFPRLQELRARVGRPHWIIVDEAHHLLRADGQPSPATIPREFGSVAFLTVEPASLPPAVLSAVEAVVAVGTAPGARLDAFAEALREKPPRSEDPPESEVLFWPRWLGGRPYAMKPAHGRSDRRRHRRKYASGDLGSDQSFYFRGPEGKLNLRAPNLIQFLELAQGVDEETWMFHLRQGDYSRWFLEKIKDEDLARETARVESRRDVSASESLALVRAAIEERYTLPS